MEVRGTIGSSREVGGTVGYSMEVKGTVGYLSSLKSMEIQMDFLGNNFGNYFESVIVVQCHEFLFRVL